MTGGENLLKGNFWGFPGGTVDGNSPASAGDMCSIPDPGRFHMLQNNECLCTTTTEGFPLQNLNSATREATAIRSPCTAMKSTPLSPQLEKPLVQQRRASATKKKKKKRKFLGT